MKVHRPPTWPATVNDALALQEQMRGLIDPTTPPAWQARTSAGLDVAYQEDSGRVAGAVVVLDMATLTVRDSVCVLSETSFPYLPGLFAFRELPVLLTALERLETVPDVLICDGQGLAHPRRFGLACHVGLLTGVATFGVAKKPMCPYDPPGASRGSWKPLVDHDEVVGRVLRTQEGVKPIFVSIGHQIDLDTASELTLRLTAHHRLPETTRLADQLARRRLRQALAR